MTKKHVSKQLPPPPKTEAEKAEIDRICREIAAGISFLVKQLTTNEVKNNDR